MATSIERKTEEAEKAQNPQYYFKFGMYLFGRSPAFGGLPLIFGVM